MSNSELNNYPPSYYAENDEKYQSIVKAYHGIKFSSFDNNITSRISVPYYTHLINKEMDIITYLTEMCIPKDFLEENYVCYHYNDLLAIQE